MLCSIVDICSAATQVNGGVAVSNQTRENMSKVDHMSARETTRGCQDRLGPGNGSTHGQKARERALSAVFSSSETPRSHQRRWSADFCKCGSSSVIAVRKSKKEPKPPERGASLRQSNATSETSFKRYSCPPNGVFTHTSPSSPSNSSCSTLVQTSAITGRDPLGWKLQPKSSSISPRTRANRLSLQIDLPVIPVHPDPSPKTSQTRPKPFRRHHSETSAFLRSLATPLPVVSAEEICAVNLRRVSLSSESDVFSRRNEEDEEQKTNARSHKIPPPVMEKTAVAIQTARLIAHSHQCCKNNEENYALKAKLKHSQQTEEHSSLQERKIGQLCVERSADQERTTPSFPG